MRLIALLLLTLPVHAADFPSFMTGRWRAAMPNGAVVEEHWTGADGGFMLGMGKTVHPNRNEFEFLRITQVDGKLTYLAMPFGKPATPFPLKSLTGTRVVFENPAHGFPQRITYWRDGERLCAKVEGKGHDAEEWCWTRF